MAATFCYKIHHALVRLFGREFLDVCVTPDDRDFGEMRIDPQIAQYCVSKAQVYKNLENIGSPSEGNTSTASSSHPPMASMSRANSMLTIVGPTKEQGESEVPSFWSSDGRYYLPSPNPSKYSKNKTPAFRPGSASAEMGSNRLEPSDRSPSSELTDNSGGCCGSGCVSARGHEPVHGRRLDSTSSPANGSGESSSVNIEGMNKEDLEAAYTLVQLSLADARLDARLKRKREGSS